MKASLLIILIFFSCLSLVSAQKKYMVKVTTLDNKVYKGLMFQVRDKDFLILPNSAHWDFKIKENNIPRTKAFDFGVVKNIKIRRKGSVGKGILIGYVAGTILGFVVAKSNTSGYDPNDYLGISRGLRAYSIIMGVTGGGLLIGNIGGSLYPHQFEVKKDTFALHKLKVQLKKYEWYHADEGMVK
jgi:hypothetical protein